MQTSVPLDRVTCTPAGSVDTALDVNLDSGARHCGMCARDASASTLNAVCPHCGHRFGWFQLLTDCTAIGSSPASEKALASYTKRYKAKLAREYGSAFDFDGPDEGY